ncbi:hypothetical protein [Rhodococcus oxybenzonivorans]|uniref:hypothetical protein n=1 Tax=Rhodococcus oxybenzonivorans TaxID=1990687 RepID=UPI001E41B03A|nr:hypothetical protein [Rhodococcus oxybenzonivorans]
MTQGSGYPNWSETDRKERGRQCSGGPTTVPSWTVLASWHRPEVVSIELLELEHPAIVDAAASQHRVLDR